MPATLDKMARYAVCGWIACLGVAGIIAGTVQAADAVPVAVEHASGQLPFGWHATLPVVDTQLAGIRHDLDGLAQTLGQSDTISSPDIAARLSRRADATKQAADGLTAQLQSFQSVYAGFADVLGKAPAAGEDAAVTAQRADITQALAQINARLTAAKLGALQARQFSLGIARQTASQHQALISQKAPSPLSPGFWREIVHEERADRAAFLSFPANAPVANARSARGIAFVALGAALVLIFAGVRLLIAPLQRLLGRVSRHAAAGALGRGGASLALIVLAGALGGVWGLFLAGVGSAVLGGDADSPYASALGLVAGLLPLCGLIAGGAAAMRQPGPTRLIGIFWPRVLAPYLCLMVLGEGALRFLEQESAIGSLSLSGLQGVFALCVVWPIWRMSSSLRGAQDGASEPRYLPPFRALTSLWVIAVTVSVVLGYLSFAYVAATWVLSVGFALGAALVLGRGVQLASEALLAPDGMVARRTHRLGVQARHLQQGGVLLSALVDLFLLFVVVSVALGNGAADPGVVGGNLQGLFTGRKIGGVQISLNTIFSCIAAFVLGRWGIALCRQWLTQKFLPTTKLDAGAQTSALSIFTYAAWIGVLLIVLSIAGLSVSNLAWIMSALSVGIGFGLQSIFQNFVSGIILLAERPVRIGDQVEIGGKLGDIRRISVRSTELRLGDGSTLIVPNSQFITSAVRNATYGELQGQVIIPVNVPPDADIERVRSLLVEAVRTCDAVPETATPGLNVTGLSEAALSLSLSVPLASPRTAGAARTAIVLAAHHLFAEAGIAMESPAPA